MNHKFDSMNLTAIETSVFDRLHGSIEDFFEKFKNVVDQNREKRLGKWYDNEDVCRILGISVRTLQNLRRSGGIGYTKICNKVYYSADDVEKALARKDNLTKPPTK